MGCEEETILDRDYWRTMTVVDGILRDRNLKGHVYDNDILHIQSLHIVYVYNRKISTY